MVSKKIIFTKGISSVFSTKKVIYTFLIILGTAYAKPCLIRVPPTETKVKLPGQPSYFFKPHPNGDRASFIYYGSNNLIDLKTGAQHTTAPGHVDGVFTPDGKFFTYPGGGLAFYRWDKLESKHQAGQNSNYENFQFTSNIWGVYQTMGVTGQNNGNTSYRAITDANEVSYIDITVDKNGNRLSEDGPYPLCDNVFPRSKLDTPVISKDGKYLSVYDNTTGTSKIYELGAKSGGIINCKEVLDLGFPAGKVDFNYKNDQLVFHVDFYDSGAGGYFSGVSEYQTKDVFAMNIEKQADGTFKSTGLARISTAGQKGLGSYYPSYDKNGRIHMARSGTDGYWLESVDPAKAFFIDLNKDPYPFGSGAKSCTLEDRAKRMALGALWQSICSNLGNASDENNLMSLSLNLDPASCQKLVLTNWQGEKRDAVLAQMRTIFSSYGEEKALEAVNNVTIKELAALCPKAAPTDEEVVVASATVETGKIEERVVDGKAAIISNCNGCHEPGAGASQGNPLHLHDMPLDVIEDSILMLTATRPEDRMPPGARLSDVDRDAMLKYLRERKLALETQIDEALTETQMPTEHNPTWNKPEGYIASLSPDCKIGATPSEWQSWLQRVVLNDRLRSDRVRRQLDQCNDVFTDVPQLNACTKNLRNILGQDTRGQLGHTFGMADSDENILKKMPDIARKLPDEFSEGLPDNWKEVATNKGWTFLEYNSQTVSNPPYGSKGRVLFQIPGERYDRWVQFTTPPEGSTRAERLIDFITVEKADENGKPLNEPVTYFNQFYRDVNGRNPVERTGSFDSCYSCHPNGMRELSPMPGSVGPEGKFALRKLNNLMKGYGKSSWNGAVDSSKHGPDIGKDFGCVRCHNSHNGDHPQSRGGIKTIHLNFATAEHKSFEDLSMSPSKTGFYKRLMRFKNMIEDLPESDRNEFLRSIQDLPTSTHILEALKFVKSKKSDLTDQEKADLDQIIADLPAFTAQRKKEYKRLVDQAKVQFNEWLLEKRCD